MRSKSLFFLVIILFSMTFISSFGYNYLDEDYITKNYIINASNHSDFWDTNLGSLDDANDTQFNNNWGTLSIDHSWLVSLLGGGGGGNPFDQSLNTTDSPTFINLTSSYLCNATNCYTMADLLLTGGGIWTNISGTAFYSGQVNITGAKNSDYIMEVENTGSSAGGLYVKSPTTKAVDVLFLQTGTTRSLEYNGYGRLIFKDGSDVVTVLNGGDGSFKLLGHNNKVSLQLDATDGTVVSIFKKEAGEDWLQEIPIGTKDVRFFGDSASGSTASVRIYGYPTGGANGYGEFQIVGTATDFQISTSRAGSDILLMPDSNVGINTFYPDYPLTVNSSVSGVSAWFLGNISAGGYNVHSPSDKETTPEELYDALPSSSDIKGDDGKLSREGLFENEARNSQVKRKVTEEVCEDVETCEGYRYDALSGHYVKNCSTEYVCSQQPVKINCKNVIEEICDYVLINGTDYYDKVDCEESIVEKCDYIEEEATQNLMSIDYLSFNNRILLSKQKEKIEALETENQLIKAELCKLGSVIFC